jgi:hypothetical protein
MDAMTALSKTKEAMDAGHMQFMTSSPSGRPRRDPGVWIRRDRPRFGPGPKTAMIAGIAL